MATIGLDSMYYSKITDAASTGYETYGSPQKLAKAISAELGIEPAEATLYADDGAAYVIKEFQSGTLTLGVDDIGTTAAADLTGATVDQNGALVSESEDMATPVAVGFRAKMPNGKYRYFWLYRVVFAATDISLETKGESITFQTPSIVGTIMRRNKPDDSGKHPWKAEVREGDTGVDTSTISGWFTSVYEPDHTPPSPPNGGGEQPNGG